MFLNVKLWIQATLYFPLFSSFCMYDLSGCLCSKVEDFSARCCKLAIGHFWYRHTWKKSLITTRIQCKAYEQVSLILKFPSREYFLDILHFPVTPMVNIFTALLHSLTSPILVHFCCIADFYWVRCLFFLILLWILQILNSLWVTMNNSFPGIVQYKFIK